MADIIIKKWNGTGWEEHYPKTTVGQIVASGTPSSTTFLRGDGTWSFVPIVTKSDLTWTYVYGKVQVNVTKGQALQFAGVQGDHILLKPAVPSEINANPDYFVGIAEANALANDFIYVVDKGEIRDVNTVAYPSGTILWYQSEGSTAGLLRATEPGNGFAKIQVGAVTKSNETEGIILVRVNFFGVDIEDIKATGTPSSTTFLRGDGTWATPASASGDFLPLTGGTLSGSLGVGGDPATASGYVYLTVGKNEANKVGILKFRSTYNSGNGSEIYQDTSGKTWLNVNGSLNAMVYDTSGNVGIGTESPSQKLHVSGGNSLFSAGDANFALGPVGGVNRIQSYSSGTNIGFLNSSDGWASIAVSSVLINNSTPVWHAGNDGSGSGLDADTTDGYNIWNGTQAQYNAITTKDPNTLYFIE
jgi:hypothetical protein